MNTQRLSDTRSVAHRSSESLTLLGIIPAIVWVLVNALFVNLTFFADIAFLAVGAWAIWFVWTYKIRHEFLVRRFRKQL